jgi:hypothetical protein
MCLSFFALKNALVHSISLLNGKSYSSMMEKNFYVITIELLIILSESRKGWPCVC